MTGIVRQKISIRLHLFIHSQNLVFHPIIRFIAFVVLFNKNFLGLQLKRQMWYNTFTNELRKYSHFTAFRTFNLKWKLCYRTNYGEGSTWLKIFYSNIKKLVKKFHIVKLHWKKKIIKTYTNKTALKQTNGIQRNFNQKNSKQKFGRLFWTIINTFKLVNRPGGIVSQSHIFQFRFLGRSNCDTRFNNLL